MSLFQHILDSAKRSDEAWHVSNMILRVQRKTGKNPAFLKIAIPDDLAEVLIKQIVQSSMKIPIRGLRLEWSYHKEDDV